MSKKRTRHVSSHSRALHEYAAQHGWAISVTNASHLVMEKAGCQAVHSSLTPSCRFATRKALADLKRAERAADEQSTIEN
uniref:Uncharacterized protein n=1 Tax=Pseudomonas phage Touem01 TaxID=3138548 RepID=A0AAU6W1V3_9VIRU